MTEEHSGQRRALLALGLTGFAGVLAGCANLPNPLANAVGSVPGVSMLQDSAEVDLLVAVGAGRAEMSNEAIRAIRDRAMPAGPGRSHEIAIMRRAYAAWLLGDVDTVASLAKVLDDPQYSLGVRVVLAHVRASTLKLQGQDDTAVWYVIKAEKLASDNGKNPQQRLAFATSLVVAVAGAIDSGQVGIAAEQLKLLPPDIDQTNALPLSKYVYACEYRRLSAHISYREGRYTDALAQARSAVRSALDRGATLIAEHRREVKYREALNRLTLTYISIQVGRPAEAAENLNELDRLTKETADPSISRMFDRANSIVAQAEGDFVRAITSAQRVPGLVWERNWPMLQFVRSISVAVLQASAKDYAAARVTLNGAGSIDVHVTTPAGIYGACVDAFVAVKLGEPLGVIARRLRGVERHVRTGHGAELAYIYWAARCMASQGFSQQSGADTAWSDDAAAAGLRWRAIVISMRQRSYTAEQTYPAHAIHAARQAALLAAISAHQRGTTSLDELVAAVAAMQETEVDAAVSSLVVRSEPPPGLTVADMRRLQDAQLAARESQARWELAAQVDKAVEDVNSPLANQSRAAASKLEKLLEEFEARAPGFSAWLAGRPPSAAAIRSALGPKDLLVAMVPLADGVGVLAITARTARVRIQAVTAAERSDLLCRLRPKSTNNSPVFLADIARTLFRGLFAGLDDLLDATDRIYLAASGSLAGVPFAALVRPGRDNARSSGERWLIRSHTLVQFSSVARMPVRAALAPSGRQARLMSFADPQFKRTCAAGQARTLEVVAAACAEQEDAAVAPSPWSAMSPLCLPETAAEAEALLRAMAGRGWVINGAQATRAAVLKSSADGQMSQASVLHFATHGLPPRFIKGVDQPALVMAAVDGTAANELLTLEDVVSLRLDASLVLLSACNTAAAGRPGGDALGGLVRGFLYAGARAVVGTHWPVDDAATRFLMVHAVKGMTERRQSAAIALRGAMLAMIEGRDGADHAWSHPEYWAPFLVMSAGAG